MIAQIRIKRWWLILAVFGAALGLAAGQVALAASQAEPLREAETRQDTASRAVGPVSLVTDIHSGTHTYGSNPGGFVTIGSVSYFPAAADGYGNELWRTDGTPEGTWLVKDIWLGGASSNPRKLTALNGLLLFWANDGSYGEELWRSDGTAEGTFMVKDAVPGAFGDSFWGVTSLNGFIYFALPDPRSGTELWRSDGTAEGTGLVKDIWPGPEPLYPGDMSMAAANGWLLFEANDGVHGVELWRTDGTEAGTTLLLDIRPGAGDSSPDRMVSVGSYVYFSANDGVNGSELWRSNGTPGGTQMVKDINPGSGASSPIPLRSIGGLLYFSASDGVSGAELWQTDGSASGTMLVKDICPGACGASISYPVVMNNELYFVANDGATGGELWRSDGSVTGTLLISDIIPGPASSWVAELTPAGDQLYFSAWMPSYFNIELLVSDGTPTGTHMVKDIALGENMGSSPSFLHFANGQLLFSADDWVVGRELWRSDGSEAGTVLVKDINIGQNSAGISTLTGVGELVYFGARVGSTGIEPWRSDGTAAGTFQLAEIYYGGNASSDPRDFTPIGDVVLFTAQGTSGRELYATDGTVSGTHLLADIYPGTSSSYPSELTVFGDKVLFTAREPLYGAELWVSDGTPGGTMVMADIVSGTGSSYPGGLTLFGDKVYFFVDGGDVPQLWVTGGEAASTQAVADLLGWPDDPMYAVASRGLFLFLYPELKGQSGDEPYDLWYSNGTPTGTVKVTTVANWPEQMAVSGDLFYFSFFSYSPTLGTELWRSDGTLTGTYMIRDIAPGPGSSEPLELTDVNGILYFTAVSPAGGRELWRSDGTPQGTWQVIDLLPGPSSSALHSLRNVNGVLLFSASDGANGQELWLSDGTAAGTVLVQNLNSGLASSDPSQFVVAGGKVFFAAHTSQVGGELWAGAMPQVELSIAKLDSADPVLPGAPLTYTLTIANASLWPAVGAALEDALPDGFQIPDPDLVDNDNTGMGFGGGVFSGTIWDTGSGGLILNGTPHGEFTSRVMDAGQVYAWNGLNWRPWRPYGLALPNWGRSETAYGAGNADMSGNLTLWHFDDPAGSQAFADTGGQLGAGGDMGASSGHYPALCWYSACPSAEEAGKFDTAVTFDGTADYLKAEMPAVLSGNTSFTVLFWMRYEAQPSRQWVMEMGNQQLGQSAHWLIWPNGDVQFGFRSAGQNVFNIAAYAGQWVAVATTYDASSGALTSYVNGLSIDSDAVAAPNLIPTEIRWGVPVGGEARFKGSLDEFAIFNRALSATEVKDLYRRGALRLGFQVRACSEPTCAGVSFVGPDGTPGSYYTDPGGMGGGAQAAQMGLLPEPIVPLDLPGRRYFQYRMVMETDSLAYSPLLTYFKVVGSWFLPSQGRCLGNGLLVTCDLGRVGGLQTLQISIPGTAPTQPGWLSNTVEIGSALFDPNLANDSDTELTWVGYHVRLPLVVRWR